MPRRPFRACTARLLDIPMIDRQDDLECDARIVGAGADFIVVEARTQCVEVQLMIDQVAQCKFEGAALDLPGQHHGQEARAAVNGFVAGMASGGNSQPRFSSTTRCGGTTPLSKTGICTSESSAAPSSGSGT